MYVSPIKTIRLKETTFITLDNQTVNLSRIGKTNGLEFKVIN